jgi:DNA-binding response OmpR family regulator
MKILVVEDDPRITDVLEYALKADGHAVRVTNRGREAIELARDAGFIVLDVGLPDIDGFEVCRLVRKFSDVPVLFLTSRADEINRVVGLEIGGDHYVVKTFSTRELLARIKAISRRQSNTGIPARAPVAAGSAAVLRYGPIEINTEKIRVVCAGSEVALTRQEFRLLELLARQPGRVFTREQLLDQAWDDGGCVTDRTIDAHIKSLRKKLGIDCIETVRGIGYRAKEL